MKCNYPIKYALFVKKRQRGWVTGLNELERDMVIDYFVVSKCYQVEEKLDFKENGNIEKSYRVVFPYCNQQGEWIRVVPEHGYSGICNAVEVDNLYDTFDEALLVAENENNKLFKNMKYFNGKGNLDVCMEWAYKMKEKQIFEEAVENATSDLVVGAEPNEQSVLVVRQGEGYLSKSSLYEWIRTSMRIEKNYCVFTVTKEDYKLLKKHIKLKGYFSGMSSPKGRPLLFYDAQKVRVDVMNPDLPDRVGNYYLNDSCYLHYDESLQSFVHTMPSCISDVKVYTVENYEDVVSSFIPYYIDEGVKDSDGIGAKKLLYIPKN